MSENRKILHIDMDAFYASVEELDFPEYKSAALVVGGSPHSRGVVTTCNYIARQYGIRSAMPTFQAYQRCPDAVFVRPRFERYQEISGQIRAIFKRYTEIIEPLSLDEAFLDVTGHELFAVQIAQRIRKEISEEIGITASAGVSVNKLVAKVASDHHKPNGITIVLPEQVKEFIGAQKVRRIPGVGPQMEKRLAACGVFLAKDGWSFSQDDFHQRFGKWGSDLWHRFQGRDERIVSSTRVRKSYGKERTFSKDVLEREDIVSKIKEIGERVFSGMTKKGFKAKTMTLKVKYSDFKQITRSKSVSSPFESIGSVQQLIPELIAQTEIGSRPIRLLGLSFSNLQ
ncbi:DNA polymerase IV [Oligoflexaceae bacterium]|nr:DNA polymerase IV [Oligoflexaceae bacterium]